MQGACLKEAVLSDRLDAFVQLSCLQSCHAPDASQALRDKYSIAAVTNDIFTREDAEFLTRNSALAPDRIMAIETGGCPHAAIREDISANLQACEVLTARHNCELVFVESGGGKWIARTAMLRSCTRLPHPQHVSKQVCYSAQRAHATRAMVCLLCMSESDNLAANFSRELADFIIYVIDVAGGDKVPRKGGPGITQSDLLVINKTDLAVAVGAVSQ